MNHDPRSMVAVSNSRLSVSKLRHRPSAHWLTSGYGLILSGFSVQLSEMQRLRSKTACRSCRERKRKCDGSLPCGYCTRHQHECSYEPIRRDNPQNMPRRSLESKHSEPLDDKRDPQLKLLEANSPAVFVRRLALKINASAAPRLDCYAWNIGFDREIAFLPQVSSITNILTLDDMHELASIYFAHVAPVYDFVERAEIHEAIVRRWANELPYDPVDSLLLGIAALGCLFGHWPVAIETRLVHSARIALEYCSQLPEPLIDHIVGWLLRVIYLRLTNAPHATWMASCTLMHLIETTRLHFDSSTDSILAQSAGSWPLPERRRKIYCVAQLFNTWVSLDCGKSQVELRGASSALPETGWTVEQRELCRLSALLTPETCRDIMELETELANLCALDPLQPMLQLLQCNIGLCVYRRARALGRIMSDQSLDSIVDIARRSLDTVNELLQASSPWWHILNIPFQIVCILLVMDHPQALIMLPDALHTLRSVADHYATGTAREAYEIAVFLVNQQRERRLQAVRCLETALQGHESRDGDIFPAHYTDDQLFVEDLL